VLKGASAATDSRMVHRQYRNFFTPEHNGIFLGFRSVSPECRDGLRAHRRPQAKQHGLRTHPTPP
jgi:hypothetical protein